MKTNNKSIVGALCLVLAAALAAGALIFAGCERGVSNGPTSDTPALTDTSSSPDADTAAEPVSSDTAGSEQFDPDETIREAIFKFGFSVDRLEFEPGDVVSADDLAEFFRYVIMPDWSSAEFVKDEYRQYAADEAKPEHDYYIPRKVMENALVKYFDVTFVPGGKEYIGVDTPIGTEARGTWIKPGDDSKHLDNEYMVNEVKCHGDDHPFEGYFTYEDKEISVDVVTRSFTLGVTVRDDGSYKFKYCRDYKTYGYSASDADKFTPGVSTVDDLLGFAPEAEPYYAEENGTEYTFAVLPVSGSDDILFVFTADGVLKEITSC